MAEANHSDTSMSNGEKPEATKNWKDYPAVVKLYETFATQLDEADYAEYTGPAIIFRQLEKIGQISEIAESCEVLVRASGDLSPELCAKLAEKLGSEPAARLIASSTNPETTAEKLTRAKSEYKDGNYHKALAIFEQVVAAKCIDSLAEAIRGCGGINLSLQKLQSHPLPTEGMSGITAAFYQGIYNAHLLDCLWKLGRSKEALELLQLSIMTICDTSPEVLSKATTLVGEAAQYAAKQPKDYRGNVSRQRLMTDLIIRDVLAQSRKPLFRAPNLVDVVRQADLGSVCYKKENELKLVKFSELKLEVANKGKLVICRTILDIFEPNTRGFLTIVEDRRGELVQLYGYNIFPDHPQRQLPRQTYLAIKEPWYKLDADLADYKRTIRIESISQLVWLPQTHSRLRGLEWKSAPEPGRATLADRWTAFEAEADRFLASGCFRPAVASLSDAISLIAKDKTSDRSRRASLHAKQAEAYWQLRRYGDCDDAAQAALALDKDHREALRLFVEANLELGDYKRARAALVKHGGSDVEIARVDKLLREKEHPLHDFKALLEKARSSPTPRLLHPEFQDPGIVVRWIDEKRGRGIFATRRFKPGELIMVSKAFEVAYFAETCLGRMYCEETRELIDLNHLTLESRIMEKICDDDYAAREDNPESTAPDAQRVRAIVKYSAFTLDRYNRETAAIAKDYVAPPKPGEERISCVLLEFIGSGVWILPSLLNHSCLPNTSRIFVGDLLILRAASAIDVGEELTAAYFGDFGMRASVKESRDRMEKLGFECTCLQCAADKSRLSSNPNLEARRDLQIREFEKEYEQLLAMSSSATESPLFAKLTKRAELFLKFYAYKNRQDPVIGSMFMKVAVFYRTKQSLSEYPRMLIQTYEAYHLGKGRKNSVRECGPFQPSASSFLMLWDIVFAYCQLDMPSMARDYFKAFKEQAVVLYGSDDPAILGLLIPPLKKGIDFSFDMMS